VSIPPAQIDGHQPKRRPPRAGEPARCAGSRRSAAAVRRLGIEGRHEAVTLAHRRRLLVEIEGVACRFRGQDVPGLALEAVERVELTGAIDVAPQLVEVPEEIAPVADSFQPSRFRHGKVGQLERPRYGRVGLGFERLVGDTEISRAGARSNRGIMT